MIELEAQWRKEAKKVWDEQGRAGGGEMSTPTEQWREQALGIKVNRQRADWYLQIGNLTIAGCQIHSTTWLKHLTACLARQMIGSGSMSISRGPYILLEPPSHNKFSNMVLGKQAADLIIDTAMLLKISKHKF